MGGALGWGALAASSVLLGAAPGCVRSWPSRPLGALLDEGFQDGAVGVSAGLAVGAVTYFVLFTTLGFALAALISFAG